MGNTKDEVTTHPSYGLVQISRMSGATNLFDSAFLHQHYIALRLHRAEAHIDNRGHETIMPKKELVEIYLSETQFSRLISTMNVGFGVPCTIHTIERERIPEPPAKDLKGNHVETINGVVDEKMKIAKTLYEKLAEFKKERKRPTISEVDNLYGMCQAFVHSFGNTLGFVHELMEESMETIINEGKTEIDAYIRDAVQRTGMAALVDKPLLLLEVADKKM